MKELSALMAEKLLNLKTIKVQVQNPFEWNTGWMSPLYFDSRKILSYRIRNAVKVELARLIMENYPTVEAVVAVAPNGIAIGVLVAEVLEMPFAYVSTEPKNHGFENRIEGDLKVHQKVVIVADQLSQGVHSVSVKQVLEQNGADVLGMVSILDYQLQDSADVLREAGLEIHSLTSYTTVMNEALEMGKITEAEAEEINRWHATPDKWQAVPQKSKDRLTAKRKRNN